CWAVRGTMGLALLGVLAAEERVGGGFEGLGELDLVNEEVVHDPGVRGEGIGEGVLTRTRRTVETEEIFGLRGRGQKAHWAGSFGLRMGGLDAAAYPLLAIVPGTLENPPLSTALEFFQIASGDLAEGYAEFGCCASDVPENVSEFGDQSVVL